MFFSDLEWLNANHSLNPLTLIQHYATTYMKRIGAEASIKPNNRKRRFNGDLRFTQYTRERQRERTQKLC